MGQTEGLRPAQPLCSDPAAHAGPLPAAAELTATGPRNLRGKDPAERVLEGSEQIANASKYAFSIIGRDARGLSHQDGHRTEVRMGKA